MKVVEEVAITLTPQFTFFLIIHQRRKTLEGDKLSPSNRIFPKYHNISEITLKISEPILKKISWKMKNKNSSLPKNSAKYSKSTPTLSPIGQIKVKFDVLEQKVATEDTIEKTFSQKNLKKSKKEKYVMPESPAEIKKMTWIDKSPFSDKNTQIIQLSKILDQASTLKEKDLKPFWTKQSKAKSMKLWLPTEIDSVDSILTSSKGLSGNTPMGKSWFSIEKKCPLNKNSSKISSPSSLPFQEDFMDSEVIQSKEKSKKQSKPKKEEKMLKTLKIRIFPNEEEKERLSGYFDQFRWYYNAILSIVNKRFMVDGKLTVDKLSFYSMRDLLRKYSYVEDEEEGKKDFVYNEEKNSFPTPFWWDKVNNRVIRGSVKKFTSSVNSAISNLKNGNISHFRMNFQSRKKPVEIVHFEDKKYPVFLDGIKSRYWFTDKSGKKKNIKYEDIGSKKGLEIIHDKSTDRYFYHVPIEVDWYPEEDRRNENQVSSSAEGVDSQKRIISLDPGVRKFLVGYDPSGKVIFVGDGASKRLSKLLSETNDDYGNTKLWSKIKNLVMELHNKTVKYLISNYDEILLPDFRVSEMIRGKKLGRMTKRLMNMFSFYKFKEKLTSACKRRKKNLYIVDESYTSCTCTNCGNMKKNLKGEEVYKCGKCRLEIDRDVNGSRNILIKNLKTLR